MLFLTFVHIKSYLISKIIANFQFHSWSINKTGHKACSYELHSNPRSEAAESQCSYGKLFTFNNDGNYMLTCGPLGGIFYKVRFCNMLLSEFPTVQTNIFRYVILLGDKHFCNICSGHGRSYKASKHCRLVHCNGK